VLGGGLVSYVQASKTCNNNACAAIISANCAGLSGSGRAECKRLIVDECNSGAISCASPSGAFLDE